MSDTLTHTFNRDKTTGIAVVTIINGGISYQKADRIGSHAFHVPAKLCRKSRVGNREIRVYRAENWL